MLNFCVCDFYSHSDENKRFHIPIHKKDAPYPLYKMKEVSCVATPKNIKRFQIASGIATFVLDNTGKNNAKDDLEWIDQIEMWDALMN